MILWEPRETWLLSPPTSLLPNMSLTFCSRSTFWLRQRFEAWCGDPSSSSPGTCSRLPRGERIPSFSSNEEPGNRCNSVESNVRVLYKTNLRKEDSKILQDFKNFFTFLSRGDFAESTVNKVDDSIQDLLWSVREDEDWSFLFLFLFLEKISDRLLQVSAWGEKDGQVHLNDETCNTQEREVDIMFCVQTQLYSL